MRRVGAANGGRLALGALMGLREALTEKERKDLIGYVRLAAIQQRSRDALDFLVELEREAIVLCHGAPLIGDPDGKQSPEIAYSMGQLILRARDESFEEFEAIAKNAYRLHTTGEKPERWTVYDGQ